MSTIEEWMAPAAVKRRDKIMTDFVAELIAKHREWKAENPDRYQDYLARRNQPRSDYERDLQDYADERGDKIHPWENL